MTHQVVANSQLEHHFHGRFAEVRCPADSFLYVADNIDHYADLENYCDDMHESRCPLLIIGECGVGKSALLSNWTQRRKKNKRKNVYLTNISSHEFIFWHAVGCTRNSTRVEVMLRRLMQELKKKFDLSCEIPTKNDRLSWDLPRFLDQASKKGAIIIVIDGINLLTSETGSEVGLTWLPLNIPPNVRIIVSVSSHVPLPDANKERSMKEFISEDMVYPSRPRFVNDVNRRQWGKVKYLRPLDVTTSRHMIIQYIKKTVLHDARGIHKSDSFITSLPSDQHETIPTADGLLMFGVQLQQLSTYPSSYSPLFLRLILESASWAVEHGYDLWALLDDWLPLVDYKDNIKLVDGYKRLFRRIVETFEMGRSADDTSVKNSRRRVTEANGLHALRQLYMWHPNLQPEANNGELNRNASMYDPSFNPDSSSKHLSGTTLASNSSLQSSLEQPKWTATFETVHIKLLDGFDAFRAAIQKGGALSKFRSAALKQRRKSFCDQVDELLKSKALSKVQKRTSIHEDSFNFESIMHLVEMNPEVGIVGSKLDSKPSSARNNPLLNDNSSSEYLNIKSESTENNELFKNIPSYLLGGTSFDGLGDFLGNALALLYTSYYGLTEGELWNLLLTLKIKSEKHPSTKLNPSESRLVLHYYQNRGAYEDVWRTMDIHKRGIITKHQFCLGIRKIDTNMSDDIIDIILYLTHHDVKKKMNVNYVRFIDEIVILDRDLRVGENATRMKPLQTTEDLETAKKPFEDNSIASIGPLIESSLLSALHCLGVLRSTEYGVLQLPIDNHWLRDVVLVEFIVPRGGLDYWHHVLTTYFQKQPSSLRRSEELPWHLESTRKWYALRDTLVDLKTFEIMSTSDLLNDLIRYWHLLSHGPLFTKPHMEMRKATDDGDGHDLLLLHNIELSDKLGLSERISKNRLMKDKIVPFDIVDAYNRSVESWVTENGPTSKDIADKIALIASFLLKFCQTFADIGAFSPYMRLPVDSKRLSDFPLGFLTLKFQDFDATPKDVPFPSFIKISLDGVNLSDLPTEIQKQPFANPDVDNDIDMEGVTLQISQYYYLRRWIWIQFPWISLKYNFELEALAEEREKVTKAIAPGGDVEETQLVHSDGKDAKGDYMIACELATAKRKMRRLTGTDEASDHNMALGTSALFDKGMGLVDASIGSVKSSRSEHHRVFWDLKKSDPSISFDSHQKSKIATRAHNQLSRSLEMEELVLKNFSQDQVFSERKLKPLHKYRRPMKESIEASKVIRFSKPSYRSSKHNTLFPSVARDLLNRHIDLLKFESKDPFELAAAVARAGEEDNFPTSLELFTEIQNIYTADTDKYTDIPKEATVDEVTTKVAKLRLLADKAVHIKNERITMLNYLKRQHADRFNLDGDTQHKLTSGEEVVTALEKRLEYVSAAILEAESMYKGYQQIMLICEQNPSHTKHHLAMVEQEVRLAKQQLMDLVKFRKNIYTEATKSDFEGSDFIRGQADYYRKMKDSTKQKRDRQMEFKRELQLTLLRNGVQKEAIENYMDFDDNDEYMEELARLRDAWKDVSISDHKSEQFRRGKLRIDDSNNTIQHSPSHRSRHQLNTNFSPLSGRERDNEYDFDTDELVDTPTAEAAARDYAQVLELTMSRSIDDVCRRFEDAKSLHTSLTNQGAMVESKIILLRSELNKLTDYFVNITISSEEGGRQNTRRPIEADEEITDSRVLDDRLIEAQLKLNQVARQTEKDEYTINEVRSGVFTLMELLKANTALLANLPGKSAHPESTSSIADALIWCEDRIIAIFEYLQYENAKLNGRPNENARWPKMDLWETEAPLAERQVELAALVENMLAKDKSDGASSRRTPKSSYNRNVTKKLGLSKGTLMSHNEEGRVELRSPRLPLVQPRGMLDINFELKMEENQKLEEEIALKHLSDESLYPEMLKKREAFEMSEFVSTALSNSQSAAHLMRRQNHARLQLSGITDPSSAKVRQTLNEMIKKPTPTFKQSRGWAMDSLLQAKNLEDFITKIDAPSHLKQKKHVIDKLKIRDELLTRNTNIEFIPGRESIKAAQRSVSESPQKSNLTPGSGSPIVEKL